MVVGVSIIIMVGLGKRKMKRLRVKGYVLFEIIFFKIVEVLFIDFC